MCERGKAGTGSVLSLDAIGKQDTFLTSNNSQNSFFKYENIRHSDFAMFERVRSVPTANTPYWPFGQDVVVTYKPTEMSDLLANIYLVMTLPPLEGIETYDAFYTDQVGKLLVEKVEFRVDEVILETLENDWNVIHDELYLTEEEKKGMKNLINAGKDNSQLPNSSNEDKAKRIPIIVPLNLFFSRKHASTNTKTMLDKYYKPYFPLCAITKQEIKITVTFRPYNYFSVFVAPSPNKTLTLDFVDFVTQEIKLSDQEKHFFQQHPFEIVYQTTRRNPIVNINGAEREFKSFLTPQMPVKTIHWFLRRTEYDLLSTDMSNAANKENIRNRINFSSTRQSNVYLEQFNPIISDAKIFLNGDQILGFVENSKNRTNTDSSNFHKLLQSQKCYLSTPLRNVYTFSFALNPREPAPTGALDFSTIDSQKSFIQCSFMNSISASDNFNFYIFFTGYQVVQFSNGFLSPKYALS